VISEENLPRIVTVFLFLVALGTTSIGTFFFVFPQAMQRQLEEVGDSMRIAGRLLQEMDLADQGRLREKCLELANRRTLVQQLDRYGRSDDASDRKEILQLMSDEISGLAAVAREAGPVSRLLLMNRTGKVLARYFESQGHPEEPLSEIDLEFFQQDYRSSKVRLQPRGATLLRRVWTKVMHKGKFLGVLLAEYPLDNRLAKIRGGELPLDVDFVYLTQEGIIARKTTKEKEEALKSFLEHKPQTFSRLISGGRLNPQIVGSGGLRLLVVGMPVMALGCRGRCGIVVHRTITGIKRPLKLMGVYLFGGACFVFLILLVITLVFGGRLSRKLRKMDTALRMSISNGSEFVVSKDGPEVLCSLASGIRTILDDTREELKFSEEEINVGRSNGCPNGDHDLDSDEYYTKLYQDYKEACFKEFRGPDKLSLERFKNKLCRQADVLCAKHKCKRIGFKVLVKDGDVRLVPSIVE
jgi:hypothetical protein